MSDFAPLFTFNVHYSRFYFKRRGAEFFKEFRSSGVTLRLGVQTIVSTMMHAVGAGFARPNTQSIHFH